MTSEDDFIIRFSEEIYLKNLPLLKVQEEAHTIPSSHLPDMNSIAILICRIWHRTSY